MRVYATAAQVENLVGVSGVTESTLRRASRDVDSILRGAVYATDSAGMPTDASVAEVLAEMTAEQVVWYQEIGDEVGVSGMGGGSIGSVTLPDLSRGGRLTPAQVTHSPKAVDLARSNLEFRVYT